MKRIFTAFSIIIVFAALVWYLFVYWNAPWTPVRVVGGIVAGLSFVLWAVARINLGQSFSIRPEAHALVTRGLYRRFRHPVYLFGTLGITGLIVAAGRFQLLWVVPVIALAQWMRTRREDRALEQAFGDTYREYRRRTWL